MAEVTTQPSSPCFQPIKRDFEQMVLAAWSEYNDKPFFLSETLTANRTASEKSLSH
jgi:hypothetical protein